MDENKKGFINEDDIATLLQRYTATTILALLQEVAHSSSQSERIDWDQLVAKTTTGITNPREYQMLWRHLAYREPVPDKHNDLTRPEDVDSDYEYEVEVTPVTADTSEEVTACVEVLIASGLPSARGQSSASARGLKNITVQGIKKQTLRARTTAAAKRGDPAKKPAMAPRRKSKTRSKKEDPEPDH